MRFQSQVLPVIGLSAALSLLTGITQCESTEGPCDGIDNDGDGAIDEDYDLDLDGYYSEEMCSTGTDCNDQAPGIHPNQEELQDGIDNDCDGQVDEEQAAYVLSFIDYYSDDPIENVPVWLGTDGNGLRGLTNANGQITFYLEDRVQDLSYLITEESEDEISYEVETELSKRIDPDETIYAFLSSSREERPRYEVSGTVFGLDTSYDAELEIDLDGCSSYATVTAESQSYTADCYYTDYILAMQRSADADHRSLPDTLGLVKYPDEVADISLDHAFDQRMTFHLENIDSRMSEGSPGVYMSMSTYNPFMWLPFYEDDFSLDSGTSFQMPAAELTGSIADMEYHPRVSLNSADGKVTQRMVVYHVVDPNLEKTMTLTTPHDLGAYEPITLESLPGTTFDIVAYDSIDDMYGYFYDLCYSSVEGQPDVDHSWRFESNDPARPIVFPAIPTGLAPWNKDSITEESHRCYTFAYTSLYYDYRSDGKSRPGTAVDIEIADDSASQKVMPSSRLQSYLEVGDPRQPSPRAEKEARVQLRRDFRRLLEEGHFSASLPQQF